LNFIWILFEFNSFKTKLHLHPPLNPFRPTDGIRISNANKYSKHQREYKITYKSFWIRETDQGLVKSINVRKEAFQRTVSSSHSWKPYLQWVTCLYSCEIGWQAWPNSSHDKRALQETGDLGTRNKGAERDGSVKDQSRAASWRFRKLAHMFWQVVRASTLAFWLLLSF